MPPDTQLCSQTASKVLNVSAKNILVASDSTSACSSPLNVQSPVDVALQSDANCFGNYSPVIAPSKRIPQDFVSNPADDSNKFGGSLLSLAVTPTIKRMSNSIQEGVVGVDNSMGSKRRMNIHKVSITSSTWCPSTVSPFSCKKEEEEETEECCAEGFSELDFVGSSMHNLHSNDFLDEKRNIGDDIGNEDKINIPDIIFNERAINKGNKKQDGNVLLQPPIEDPYSAMTGKKFTNDPIAVNITDGIHNGQQHINKGEYDDEVEGNEHTADYEGKNQKRRKIQEYVQ